MSENPVVQMIFVVIIVLVFGYYTVRSLQQYHQFRIASKEFLASHTDTEPYRSSKAWFVWIALGCALSLFFAILGTMDQSMDLSSTISFYALAVAFVGLYAEGYTRRNVWYTDDGFFFIDTYYRFRSIRGFEEKGKFAKSMEITLTNQEYLDLPVGLGTDIRNRYEQWKVNKKKNKRHGSRKK